MKQKIIDWLNHASIDPPHPRNLDVIIIHLFMLLYVFLGYLIFIKPPTHNSFLEYTRSYQREAWASGYTEGLLSKAVEKAINPNDIIKYFDEKDKRIILETPSGAQYWDGKYALSAKDILDFLIDVVQ